MASRQQIKARIRSVRNTRQITKAMELVAASRMRRASELVTRARLYGSLAAQLLGRLRQAVNVSEFALFAERPVRARLLIVIASDRGLAGAFNSNVLRRFITELRVDRDRGVKTYAIVIGRQAANLSAKLDGLEVVGVYQNFPDDAGSDEVLPILGTALELFTEQTVDTVDVVYTQYFSSLRQEVTLTHLLPAGFEDTPAAEAVQADFEPSAEVVLETATRRLLEAKLTQALLESAASEHSMRMLAMKSATDNATELADDLTLAYNNARQAAITQELAEISGGAEALNE